MSIRERWAMIDAWADHDMACYQAFRSAAERVTQRPISRLRVLDLGCGSNAPMTVLLHAAGCRVTGVDTTLAPRWGLGFRPSRYGEFWRRAGVLATFRKMAGEMVFDRRYFARLRERTQLPLADRGLDLRIHDVERLDTLGCGVFDVIHSNATWEHVQDVPRATRALATALASDGLAYIEIHLFPSVSGGHDLPWIVPGKLILNGHEPWRHLTDPAWVPPVPLNRFREADYRAAFEAVPELEIVDWSIEFTEGHELLTAERRVQLADYSERDLTTRSIIVQARRR
jgi:SAM-dependent methyltransferase